MRVSFPEQDGLKRIGDSALTDKILAVVTRRIGGWKSHLGFHRV